MKGLRAFRTGDWHRGVGLTPRRVAFVAVALHLLTHAAHGVVHELVPVRIADWQTAYVVVSIYVAPLLGVAVAARGRLRTAATLLILAGVASLAFELPAHFLIENPDHVGAVGDSTQAFALTAVLGAGAALLLVVVGTWLLVCDRDGE